MIALFIWSSTFPIYFLVSFDYLRPSQHFFSVMSDGSSWVKPVQSKDFECVLPKDTTQSPRWGVSTISKSSAYVKFDMKGMETYWYVSIVDVSYCGQKCAWRERGNCGSYLSRVHWTKLISKLVQYTDSIIHTVNFEEIPWMIKIQAPICSWTGQLEFKLVTNPQVTVVPVT